MNTDLIKLIAAAMFRHGLGIASAFLVQHGLAAIDDATSSKILEILLGATGIVVTLAWSWAQKHWHLEQLSRTALNQPPSIKIQ